MMLDGPPLSSSGRRGKGELIHALVSSRKNNLVRFKNVLRKWAEYKRDCGGKNSQVMAPYFFIKVIHTN